MTNEAVSRVRCHDPRGDVVGFESRVLLLSRRMALRQSFQGRITAGEFHRPASFVMLVGDEITVFHGSGSSDDEATRERDSTTGKCPTTETYRRPEAFLTGDEETNTAWEHFRRGSSHSALNVMIALLQR